MNLPVRPYSATHARVIVGDRGVGDIEDCVCGGCYRAPPTRVTAAGVSMLEHEVVERDRASDDGDNASRVARDKTGERGVAIDNRRARSARTCNSQAI